MFNCNGVFPISKCSGADIKRDVRLNQKLFKLNSSHHILNKKALTVINNGKEYSEDQNNQGKPVLCVTNVGGPGTLKTPMFRFNNKMRENNMGLDKKHGSYERYLARKRGWNLLNQSCNINNKLNICLQSTTVMNANNSFKFNNSTNPDITYLLSTGTYVINNVSFNDALYLFNSGKENLISITSDTTLASQKNRSGFAEGDDNLDTYGIPDGSTFYYGDVHITVKGNFDKMSIFSFKNGYLSNGLDLFSFDSRCN